MIDPLVKRRRELRDRIRRSIERLTVLVDHEPDALVVLLNETRLLHKWVTEYRDLMRDQCRHGCGHCDDPHCYGARRAGANACAARPSAWRRPREHYQPGDATRPGARRPRLGGAPGAVHTSRHGHR